MANPKHLKILKQGVEAWNKWRDENPGDIPDLSKENLRKFDLRRANLSKANLYKANLSEANLKEADLSGAILKKVRLGSANLRETNLSHAQFRKATLRFADFSDANLSKASLRGADLRYANFSRANLSNANLKNALLVETELNAANLSGCRVYGISAWKIKLQGTIQTNLIISPRDEPEITVDNLEVAQFIYLLLSRKKLRNVIDTITSKSVLILGRFTTERKAILEAMASELRRHNLVPIIFDFDRASSRDFIETIKTLAGLSLFVIADITKPSSVPLELEGTVPDYQIPFVPIIQENEKAFAMFKDLTKYPWVLQLLTYPSSGVLIQIFKKAIIDEAFEMHKKLLKVKAEAMETRSAEDYLKESDRKTIFWLGRSKLSLCKACATLCPILNHTLL